MREEGEWKKGEWREGGRVEGRGRVEGEETKGHIPHLDSTWQVKTSLRLL